MGRDDPRGRAGRVGHRLALATLLVVVAVLFLLPWTFAAQSLTDALRFGWPGPYPRHIAELQADESMFQLALSAGLAILLLAVGLIVVAVCARTFGIRVAPITALGGAGVVAVASVIAFSLTT